MTGYDLLLSGGWIVDGTGAPPYRGDLAVAGGRIAAVGALGEIPEGNVATTLDVTGRYVFPGLVDTHVHADAVVAEKDAQLAMLRQGITSLVLGQDGVSFAPGSAETVAYAARYFAAINGAAPPELAGGCSVADLLDHHDRRTPINVSYLVPLGTVRHEVVGPGDRRATPEEVARMRGLVEAGLEEGAVGISTGLEYVPGTFADLDELTELCRPAAAVGAPYVSHLRSYAGGHAPGVDELAVLSRRSGVPGHISHYRGRAEPLTAHLDECWSSGLDVTFDTYPHLQANTILAMKGLPSAICEGGVSATVARLADPRVRAELEREWFGPVELEMAEAVLGYVAAEDYRWAEGMSLADAATRAGTSFGTLVCDLLVASDLAVGCIIPTPLMGGEDDVRALLRHPGHMGCSDGIYLGGHPHPRGWGAFARFLGRHTRVLGDWSWGGASLHLSGHATRRFGLAERGLLRPGMVADLAVIDPETVADQATYAEPRLPATGVSHVAVAGELVLADGELTGATPGRALRRGRSGLSEGVSS